MDIQEYTDLIYKLKRYYKLNNIHNTDRYQQKIKEIGKILGDNGIIQFGGVLSHEQIKDLLKDTPQNISDRLKLELNLELYKSNVDILVKNHEAILTIIEDYKNAILKLIEEKDKCFDDLQDAKSKSASPEEIRLLESKLSDYETKLKEKVSTLKLLVRQKDEKNVDKVKEEISDYLTRKSTGADIGAVTISSESEHLLSPVREIIDKIDKFLGK